MKYLVKYQLVDHPMYEYFVVDEADNPDHAVEQLWDAYPDDDITLLTVYELREVEYDPIDFDCEVCGAPNRWPLCAYCEQHGYGI